MTKPESSSKLSSKPRALPTTQIGKRKRHIAEPLAQQSSTWLYESTIIQHPSSAVSIAKKFFSVRKATQGVSSPKLLRYLPLRRINRLLIRLIRPRALSRNSSGYIFTALPRGTTISEQCEVRGAVVEDCEGGGMQEHLHRQSLWSLLLVDIKGLEMSCAPIVPSPLREAFDGREFHESV